LIDDHLQDLQKFLSRPSNTLKISLPEPVLSSERVSSALACWRSAEQERS
jgi:hypothetical protein